MAALLAPAAAWGQEGTTPEVIIVPVPLEPVAPPVVVGQPAVVVAPPPVIAAPPVVAPPVVTPPAIVATSPLAGETTEVVIRSVEGEGPLPVSALHQGPGGDDDGYDLLCMTPCTLQLAPGEYELKAGDSRTFDVAATGGRQEWEVEDDSVGGIIAGAVLTFSGPLGLALPGMGLLTIDWGDNEYNQSLGYTFIGLGAALGVLGMLLWVESTGGADLVSETPAAPPVGLNLGDAVLVPSFAVAPDERGELTFGLGFSLTL